MQYYVYNKCFFLLLRKCRNGSVSILKFSWLLLAAKLLIFYLFSAHQNVMKCILFSRKMLTLFNFLHCYNILIMIDNYKLLPFEPTTNCKIAIIKERLDRDSLQLCILGWARVLPNKCVVPVVSLDPATYQCSALDSYCNIEVLIQKCKTTDKLMKRTLTTAPVSLSKELRERTLYQIPPCECKVSIDEWCIKAKVVVENKRIKLISDLSRFQIPLNERMVEIQPYNLLTKFNFGAHVNDFLKFFGEALKWVPKLRSSSAFFIFNSKMDQDLFLFSVTDSFRDVTFNVSKIKLVGTVTPRALKSQQNELNLKNDGSSSSLASNTKSITKNSKQKVRITEGLNLKKSHSKVSSTKPGKEADCLNIFENEEEFGSKATEQSSFFKNSDVSMDLRGSFEELQKNLIIQDQDDKHSNHSFRQKDNKLNSNSMEQENFRLKTQNSQLKKEVESMTSVIKEFNSLKRKYDGAVNELKRLESERIAIVKDKMKFQSAYYEELQEKEKIKRQLESLSMPVGANRINIGTRY